MPAGFVLLTVHELILLNWSKQMRWAQDVQTGSGRPWRDSFLFHLENSRKSLMKDNGKKIFFNYPGNNVLKKG